MKVEAEQVEAVIVEAVQLVKQDQSYLVGAILSFIKKKLIFRFTSACRSFWAPKPQLYPHPPSLLFVTLEAEPLLECSEKLPSFRAIPGFSQ